jgi:SPP1 gp7 family putative phage head morphogenesis protein
MATTTRKPRPKDRTVRAVRPNVGLRRAYQRRLTALIDEMADSCEYWVGRAYTSHEPLADGPGRNGTIIRAMDDRLPTNVLKQTINELRKRWLKRFDDAAPKLAKWFAKSTAQRSKAQLMKILKDGGYTVEFRMSQAQRDVMAATLQEQVGLIKSIPEKYLGQVQGDVMRSISAGRDLATLNKALRKNYGSTKKRAALIARDQNNKATATMTRARQLDLGITEAIWMHSHAGKKPRPTHLKNDGKRYKIAKGWFDPDPKVNRFIIPGELINCRCVSKSVIPGFS